MRKLACVVLVCVLAGFCGCGRGTVEEATTIQSTTTETTTAEYTTEVWYTADSFENKYDLAWAREAFNEWYFEPEVIEPFKRVTVRAIDMNEPQFIFIVHGYFGMEKNRDRYMVYAVDILNGNGEIHQRLDGFTTLWFGDDLVFEDFNHDGYVDIQLHACEGGSMRNEPSLFWLWDAKQYKYVENEQLEEISSEASVTVEDDGRIRAYTREGAWGYYLSYYSYRSDKFIEVEIVDVHPQDENDISNSGKAKDTYKLINGEMKLVSTEILEEYP